jgi:hypothetical protein
MSLLSRPALSTVIDTSTKLTSSEAAALYQAGVRSVWRYVFFGPPRPGDLDAAELALLTAAGLTVMVVQHVRNPGWQSGGEPDGSADARWALANAGDAGYRSDPGGPELAICFDAEGIGNPGPNMVAHAASWCSCVASLGYQPVVYIGYDSGLRAADLDALPGSPLFWCDYAPLGMRPKPARGYVGHQQAQTTLCGVGVDVDAILVPGALYGLGSAPDLSDETPDTRPDGAA